PRYEATFGDAYNYGSIGAVMGHELTHGFDDDGRKFDGNGQLRDWWSVGVAEQFNLRAQCLVDQYSQYQALPGVNVNGKRTLGENIADLGGLRTAYAAYKALGEDETFQGSFDAEEQFFLSYAQQWCANRSPDDVKTMVSSDTHSPERFRVNGVVSNMSA